MCKAFIVLKALVIKLHILHLCLEFDIKQPKLTRKRSLYLNIIRTDQLIPQQRQYVILYKIKSKHVHNLN